MHRRSDAADLLPNEPVTPCDAAASRRARMSAPRELLVAVTDLAPFAAAEDLALPRLPALEALLARAERTAAPADWRRWSLDTLGLQAAPGDLPIGATLAAAAGLDTRAGTWLVAAPVHLQATLTHVRMHAAGELPLAPAVAASLAARANATFGQDALGSAAPSAAEFTLHAAGGLLLARFAAPLDVRTHDPASHAGRAIGAQLPHGPDGGRVRRCMTELQMWLHANPIPAGAPDAVAPNALWLWGGGRELVRGAVRWPALDTDDAWLRALHALDAREGRAPGEGARSLATRRLAALAASGDAGDGMDALLARADREWFAALAARLARGELARVTLHLGTAAFDLRPAQRWRVWRRPRPWWELAA